MFESLTEKLQNTFDKLKGHGKLTEKNVSTALHNIKLALLEADVHYKVVRDFIANVKEKSLGQDVLGSLTPELQIAKFIGDELTRVMGTAVEKISVSPSGSTTIMMVGLQGSGKTTSSAKLALRYKKDGRHPLLIAADIYRPAAIKQLETLGNQIDVPVFSMGTKRSPVAIAKAGLKYATKNGNDIIILDTAGRLEIDENLMAELNAIKSEIDPTEILLVVDAMTGQSAVNVAKTFNAQLDLGGILLTKLDGDARGGAALSIRSVTGKPIKLVSTGEKIDSDTLEPFYPDRMASRILGQGDFKTLLDRADAVMDKDYAEELQHKLVSHQEFNFNDLLQQLEQLAKMGPLDQVVSMVPGMAKMMPKGSIGTDENQLKQAKAIIQSMTPGERLNYQSLNRSRRMRIATGSGSKVNDVNQLVNQLKAVNKMFKSKSVNIPELGIKIGSRKTRKLKRRKKRRK